jgi:hypothetical protein
MSWSDPALTLLHRLPPRTRETVQRLIGAGGQSESRLNSWQAKRLAAREKHPAKLLPQVARICAVTERPLLDGARVMEYGSGYLLAEPLLYTLFGADEVTAVDATPLLQSKVLRDYATDTDWRVLIEQTLPAFDTDRLERWIRRLQRAASRTNEDWYRDLGIRYIAPHDILTDNEPRKPFDLIVSRSTLEHAPPELATAVFDRLTALLAKNGSAYHHIHLEDHRDIDEHPFGFLSALDDYGPDDVKQRGNRLRASDWWQSCVAQTDMHWKFEAAAPRLAQLPRFLASEFETADPHDLAIGHLTLIGRRLPAQPLPAAENPV